MNWTLNYPGLWSWSELWCVKRAKMNKTRQTHRSWRIPIPLDLKVNFRHSPPPLSLSQQIQWSWWLPRTSSTRLSMKLPSNWLIKLMKDLAFAVKHFWDRLPFENDSKDKLYGQATFVHVRTFLLSYLGNELSIQFQPGLKIQLGGGSFQGRTNRTKRGKGWHDIGLEILDDRVPFTQFQFSFHGGIDVKQMTRKHDHCGKAEDLRVMFQTTLRMGFVDVSELRGTLALLGFCFCFRLAFFQALGTRDLTHRLPLRAFLSEHWSVEMNSSGRILDRAPSFSLELNRRSLAKISLALRTISSTRRDTSKKKPKKNEIKRNLFVVLLSLRR